MAGKTSCTCSRAAPLSRPANARRRAKRAAGPAERPGKHKRSTRATQEEHKRATRYPPAIPWLATGSGVALGAFARLFRILHSAFCIRPKVAIPWLAPRLHHAVLPAVPKQLLGRAWRPCLSARKNPPFHPLLSTLHPLSSSSAAQPPRAAAECPRHLLEACHLMSLHS
jgi:hypothetical protein